MSNVCAACGIYLDEIIKLQARIDELERSAYRPEVVAKLQAEVALANLEARAAQARCTMVERERDALGRELASLGASASERIIFLDFDGVINHSGTFAALDRKYQDESNWSQFGEAEWFEPVLVARVGALAAECGASIAVISSWRERHDRAGLCDLLRRRGLPARVVVESCERGCSKGEAIRRFLLKRENHGRPVTAYVVLDDGPGEVPNPTLLVKTDSSVGLTEQDVSHARRILLGTSASKREC